MFNKAELITLFLVYNKVNIPCWQWFVLLYCFWFQHDVKNHRTFLKRTKYEDLHLEDLFIGNKVNIFSRQLVLLDYGDQYTARQLGSRKEK